MSNGPGRYPCIQNAASSTAAGALPGMASESTGMIAPPTAALLPASEETTPSMQPFPHRSGVLETFFSDQ